MNSDLIDMILQLEPTGAEGFEGLVADLLETLTGCRFQLARSGSQMGRDMSGRHRNANVIAVECKRYGREKEFNERELQGELTQAIMDIPDLDLWVLVTSRSVPSQLHQLLHEQAQRAAMGFLTVSAEDGEPSSLGALCALSSETVIEYLESGISEDEKQRLIETLEDIARHSQFTVTIKRLQEQFRLPLIGYDNWRSAQNQWFDTCLASEKESRANFSQPLNVRETDVMLVPRSSAWARLDEWFSSWGDTHETFVMLGEEGDGKTWAVASWLDRNIQKDGGFPAVVFLSSTIVNGSEPLRLLSRVTSRRLRTPRVEDWAQRIARWVEEPASDAPRVLLVLDGINERGEPTWWRGLIEQLAGSPWRASVAVLITCRTGYWQKYFAPLRYLDTARYELPPYSAEELDVALDYYGLSRSEIPDSLLTLIRKPRYFDLMVRHRQRMAESGDITRARLIYEDWRDRVQRKRLGMDEEEFRSFLKALASEYLEKEQDYPVRPRLGALLPPYLEDKRAIVEELRTGGVLTAEEGHLQVNEDRLVHGFGLLLVDQIRGAAATGRQDWGEIIAQWLEPRVEMDIKARIWEFAALHALHLTNLPQEAKVALLDTWVSAHNPGEEAAENLIAYLPLDPSCYTQLAEVVWSDATENPWAQELLMDAFLKWHSVSEVTSELESSFKRWLGLVHLYGASHHHIEAEEDAQRLRQEICDRVGLDLEPGPFEFAGRSLTATEDVGLLRLGRAALAVISHISRGPFAPAIATGCVAEAIMGSAARYDLLKWVTSTAPQSVWSQVKQEVDQLLEFDHFVTKQASYRMLSFEGSEQAHRLRSELPDNLFPASPWREAHKKDPCTSVFAWTRETCEGCLLREDLAAQHIAMRSRRQSLNPSLSVPEDLETRLEPLVDEVDIDSIWSLLGPTSDDTKFDQCEPALCAFAPRSIAQLVRAIVRQADQREGMSLRQLAWRIKEHYLVLEEEEKDSVYRAWERLYQASSSWDKTQREAETFLFGPVLKNLTAGQQFEHLLKRPDDAADLIAYERNFSPLEDWDVAWNELATLENPKRTHRAVWFLSAHPDAIPGDRVSEELVSLLQHSESVVRSSVLRIAYFAQNEELIKAFVGGGWSWSASLCHLENHWGNLLLCEHGDSLSYSQLRNRLHPSYLGYAVKCRGLRDEEINQYAEDIHHIWSRVGTETPDLPIDFPPVDTEVDEDVTAPTYRSLSPSTWSKSVTFFSRSSTWGGVNDTDATDLFEGWESTGEERQKLVAIARQATQEQVEAGNVWFADRFYPDALVQVLESRPDLVSEWVDSILEGSDAAVRCVTLARSFYIALCRVLLRQDPDAGNGLYQRLNEIEGGVTVRDARSKIRVLDYALFEAPPTDDVRRTWTHRLERCTTDQELMQVAIVAQRGNGQDWLQSYVDQRTDSSAPLEKSRELTLLGFIETQQASERLAQLAETEPQTWIGDLVKTSSKRWQMSAWAKHWFERFLTVEDDVKAWAAFRLFLHCVDSRFWLWQRELRSTVEEHPRLAERMSFWEDNSHTIEKRIRKNEKDLKKHLFGQKTKPGQAWPWM